MLETIRTTASYAISNREEFIQKVRSISQVRQQEVAKELKRKVAKAQKRIAELDVLIKKLYETYAMGKLEEKRFEMLSTEYEKEQDELEQTLASDQASLDQFNEDTDRADKFLALAKKYTDFSELTAPMINEFVEKIVVHARPTAALASASRRLKFISSSSENSMFPCRSRPRRSWQWRKSAARSASATMRSICGRRNARKRLPRGRSCRVNRIGWCASAAGKPSTPSAPTPSSARPPAVSGSTASKNGSFRRLMQYPSRNLWKPAKPHNTEHSGLPNEGRPLFLCPNMEVLF